MHFRGVIGVEAEKVRWLLRLFSTLSSYFSTPVAKRSFFFHGIPPHHARRFWSFYFSCFYGLYFCYSFLRMDGGGAKYFQQKKGQE